jgi:hypothetical protein
MANIKIGTDELKLFSGGYITMAVSLKASPVITGKSALKLMEMIKNPSDKTELFKKCEQLSKIFTTK